MFAIISSIILLLAGIISAVVLSKTKHREYDGNAYRGYTEVSHKKFAFIPIVASVALSLIIVISSCITIIPTGHTGVVTTFGKVENQVFDAGLNAKLPWQSVVEMDNRVQKVTITLACFSSDIQEVDITYSLNYQIDKSNAQLLYKTVGKAYQTTVIDPAVTKSVKVVTARYNAEELVSARAELASSIESLLAENLAEYNIQIVSTSIEDMDFTDAFTNAVEAKQVAAQDKLKAEIQQQQAVLEAEAAAQRAIIEAEAEAEKAVIDAEAAAKTAKIQAEAELEVTKIQADASEYAGQKEAAKNKAVSESLTDELLQYYYVQQWNGVLPDTYVGSDDVSAIISGK